MVPWKAEQARTGTADGGRHELMPWQSFRGPKWCNISPSETQALDCHAGWSIAQESAASTGKCGENRENLQLSGNMTRAAQFTARLLPMDV